MTPPLALPSRSLQTLASQLRFGSFITPSAIDPEQAVRLAVASEDAGFDLVTFQDHPYQPAFLDTWTLLTFVAARTERIELSGDVLNLPLRPPAVLARAAASLDLLSGGRLTLALGAGAFWDAIVGMGGPRRKSGESVTALEEGIQVIRQLWDTENRELLRFEGEFYRLDGARRGPKPAHAVPIWLGGFRPRMLRTIGTLADGWIASLGTLQTLEDLAASNHRITESAEAAGRNPQLIRRAINLPAERADPVTLAHLAVEVGFDTFIVQTDEAGVLRSFARDVVPYTRELVRAAVDSTAL